VYKHASYVVAVEQHVSEQPLCRPTVSCCP